MVIRIRCRGVLRGVLRAALGGRDARLGRHGLGIAGVRDDLVPGRGGLCSESGADIAGGSEATATM